MQEITIDEEFRLLLPELDKETFALLEESLLQHGCMHPIVLWGNTIIDGHNRHSICIKHGIPFLTKSMEFDSRDDVIVWIISTQVSRRNLSPIQLSFFRGLHYGADKRKIANEAGKNQHSEVVRQNDGQPKTLSTASRLAGQYNVSPRTIERDARVAEAISAIGKGSPEAKRSILAGKTRISRRQLQELAAGANDDVVEIAISIENGTFEKRRSAQTKPLDGVENRTDNSFPDFEAGLPFDAVIDRMTETFFSDLQRYAKASGHVDFKETLRSVLDRLEGLYLRI